MFKKFLVSLVLGCLLISGNVFAKTQDELFCEIDINKKPENYADISYKNSEAIKYIQMYNVKDQIYGYMEDANKNGFNELAKDFKPVGKTDIEKINSLVKYIRTKGIYYSPRTDYNIWHQFENLKNGHTMCLGMTMYTSKLLDKTGIEYRYVLVRPRDANTLEVPKDSGGHIYLEIKTDKGHWMKFDSTMIITVREGDDFPFNWYYKTEIESANEREDAEIIDRNYSIIKHEISPETYPEFSVSPSYKNGKPIDTIFRFYKKR